MVAVSRWLAAAALGLGILGPWTPADAVCPCGGGNPGGPVPVPSGGGPAPTLGGVPSATTPGRRIRGPETLDDRAWEYWWATVSPVLLPPIGAPALSAGDYVPGRDSDAEASVDALIVGLSDPDDQVRTAAGRALAVVDSPYRKADQEAALRKAFTDQYREVREVAGLALARRGASDLVARLRQVLEDPTQHEVTRGFAGIALVLLRDPAGVAAALKIARTSAEPAVAGAIWLALGAQKDPAHAPALLAAAERVPGPAVRARRVRCDAIAGLGLLGEPATLSALGTHLRDRERAVARAAALAFGGFEGDETAYAALRRWGLAADDAFVRAFAAVSLGRIGRMEALPSLNDLAREEEHPAVRPFVLLGLGLLGHQAGSGVVREVLSARRFDGQWAAAALAAGLLKSSRDEPHLAAALGGDALCENAACTALGMVGAAGRAPELRRRLWIDDATLQFGVVTGLGYLDAPSTAVWLGSELAAVTADHRRGPLAQALSMVGSGEHARALAALAASASAGRAVRVRAIHGIARVLNGRRPSWASVLCAHQDYLNPNTVVWHLSVFP